MVIDRSEFFQKKWSLTVKKLRDRGNRAEIVKRIRVLPPDIQQNVIKGSLAN